MAQDLNKDEIYKNSYRQDIPRNMQDIPYEDKDYHSKHYSPYALVRLPKKCRYKNEVLTPGYYLVKPFTENDVSYLLFKNKGQATALVPVFDRSELPKKVKKINHELFVDRHGERYLLTIRYQLNQYSVALDIFRD
jgi:hypothetical protein